MRYLMRALAFKANNKKETVELALKKKESKHNTYNS